MKLRIFSLTAVFFSVGIAFAIAEEPADEDTLRETTYTFDSSTAADDTNISFLSFYHTADNKVDDTTLFDRIGLDGNKRNDYTIDYEYDDIGQSFYETSFPASDKEAQSPAGKDGINDEVATLKTSRTFNEDKSRRIYDFSVSFYDSVTEKIGFTARSDRKNPLVFYEVIAKAPDNSQLPDNETFSFLSFDKRVFSNALNGAKIISGGSYLDENKEDSALVMFSSIITIPFAILIISVSGGLFLVALTSTREKTNV